MFIKTGLSGISGLLGFLFIVLRSEDPVVLDGPFNWTASSDANWSNTACWSRLELPDQSAVVKIRTGGDCVVDASTGYAAANYLQVGAGATPGARLVIEDGAYLYVRLDLKVAVGSEAFLDILHGGLSSETFTIGASNATGHVTISQGVVLSGNLTVTNGTLELKGGTFQLKRNTNGCVAVASSGFIDIYQGALALTGDHTASNSALRALVGEGKIRAVDQYGVLSGQLVLRYADGKTWVERLAPSAASQPLPVYGDPSVWREDAVLTWRTASSAQAQRVYLGTNIASVTARDVSALMAAPGTNQSSWTAGTLLPHSHYYWAVDSLKDGVWTPGPVWRFTTSEQELPYSGGLGFAVGPNGELLDNGVPYRGFGLTFHYGQDERIWDGNIATLEPQLGAMFDDLQTNHIPFLRTWLLMDDLYFTDKLKFFEKKDALVNLAGLHGIRLFPQMGANPIALTERSGEPFSALTNDASYSIELLRKYARDVAIRYRTSSVVCGWELTGDVMNSADLTTDSIELTRPQMWNLYEEWAKEVTLWDPYRCMESGQTFTHLDAWHLRYTGKRVDDTPEQNDEMIEADMAAFNTASFHVYPGKSERTSRHMLAARRLGKPAYLGEFGGTNSTDFAAVVGQIESNDCLYGTVFAYFIGDAGHEINFSTNRYKVDEIVRMNRESDLRAFFVWPPNEMQQVPLNPELSWLTGQKVTSTVLYLGTNQSLVAARDISTRVATLPAATNSYALSGLQPASRHYWVLDTLHPGGTFSGEVRAFRTEGYAECYLADDTYVYNGAPDQNFDGGQWLRLREGTSNKYRSYILFAVDQLGTNAAQSVQLRFQSSDYSGPVVLYTVPTNWQSSTLTWNTAPLLTNTPVAVLPVTPGGFVTFDVTTLVRSNGLYAFAMKAGAADIPLGWLYSFENPVENKPVLIIRR